MNSQELVTTLHTENGSKIVLIVDDGLGGCFCRIKVDQTQNAG